MPQLPSTLALRYRWRQGHWSPEPPTLGAEHNAEGTGTIVLRSVALFGTPGLEE